MSKRKKNRYRQDDIVNNPKRDYTKYYLFIIKAGIVACLFLPLLVVHSHMFAMQVGKVLVFRTIIEIIAFFYIILIIKKEEYRPKWGLFELSIAAFIMVYLLTSLTGVNFLRSFWGTTERMGGFFTMLHFWAYFMILISVFRTKKDWKILFSVSIFVAVISSMYAFGQSAFFWRDILPWIKSENINIYTEIARYVTTDNFVIINDWRTFGMIGNAGPFAGYIMFNVLLGLYVISSARSIKNKFSGIIALLFLFSALSGAGTRSAYIAILAGFAVLSVINVILSKKKKMRIVSVLFILLLIIGSGIVWANKKEDWVKNSTILSRMVSISFENNESRTMTWESSWKGFADRPLLGAGPENYNVVFNKYFNPLHFTGYGSTSWYDKAHNIFLDILTTMGIVGLLSYLGIFAIIYWFLIKNRRKARENLPAFALIASLPVAYFVQNMFWFDDFSSYLMLFMFFAFVSNFFNHGLGFEYSAEKGKKVTDFIRRKLSLKASAAGGDSGNIIIAVAGIVLIFSTYSANFKAWRFHDLTTVAVGAISLNADDSFLWYKEAMKNSTYLGRQELYKRFGNYANAKYVLSDPGDRRKTEEFQANLKFAISEMENAVAENKEDVQFYSLLGALYNKYYSNFREPEYIDKAEKTLQRAVELSPERETVYYEYGQAMVFKKDYKKAIELFKKGVDLNPPVPISHWYLGMAYLNAKEYGLADSEISEAIKLGYGYKTIKDLLSITPIYIELKDYQRLEKIYLDVLELDQNNPEIYVSLALVYRELGDKTGAIKMAEKAISLDESFRVEGEKFIDELEGGK
ncbi:MAG: O-antigen ligase family protein [Candidatus Paceibacterota bacterium]|jgi:tetratricopeptide (TPR) repeat protein